MPKSKNRRKNKKSSQGDAGNTTSAIVDAPAPDDAGSSSASAKAKRKTDPMTFFRQVRDEGQKVTWTTKNETMISTVMVLIMVTIMSIFFFVVDEILSTLMPFILTLFA